MFFWLISGIAALVLAGLGACVLLLGAGLDAGSSFEERTAPLTCFHCGRKTDSGRPRCQHCGRELQ